MAIVSGMRAGIRYVVDAGRSKQRLQQGLAGLARFEVSWISQSGAAQRAGRAGRTGPGHCYRHSLACRLEPLIAIPI